MKVEDKMEVLEIGSLGIMMQNSNIQLGSSCIMNDSLQTYNDDFTFIVNGKEFHSYEVIEILENETISLGQIGNQQELTEDNLFLTN